MKGLDNFFIRIKHTDESHETVSSPLNQANIILSDPTFQHSKLISYSCIHFVDVYFLFIDGKPPPPTETEMAAKLARLKGWKTFMVYIATET